MLNELIFLGRIPGTNLQLTFSELVGSVDLLVGLFLLRKHSAYLRDISAFIKYLAIPKGTQLRLPV